MCLKLLNLVVVLLILFRVFLLSYLLSLIGNNLVPLACSLLRLHISQFVYCALITQILLWLYVGSLTAELLCGPLLL